MKVSVKGVFGSIWKRQAGRERRNTRTCQKHQYNFLTPVGHTETPVQLLNTSRTHRNTSATSKHQ